MSSDPRASRKSPASTRSWPVSCVVALMVARISRLVIMDTPSHGTTHRHNLLTEVNSATPRHPSSPRPPPALRVALRRGACRWRAGVCGGYVTRAGSATRVCARTYEAGALPLLPPKPPSLPLPLRVSLSGVYAGERDTLREVSLYIFLSLEGVWGRPFSLCWSGTVCGLDRDLPRSGRLAALPARGSGPPGAPGVNAGPRGPASCLGTTGTMGVGRLS